jgi:hypothetical protein
MLNIMQINTNQNSIPKIKNNFKPSIKPKKLFYTKFLNTFFTLVILFSIISFNNLNANILVDEPNYSDENVEEVAKSNLKIGLNLGYKLGFNAIPPVEGRKNDLGFAPIPDFGLSTKYYLEDTDNHLVFDINYSNYQFIVSDATLGTKYPHNVSYLSFSPSVMVSQFSFGFTYGMPMSTQINSVDFDIEKINSLVEINIGYNYEIYSDEDGSFMTFGKLSYALNGFMDNYAINDPLLTNIPANPIIKMTNEHNPRIASFQLGFSYLFNM